MCSVAKRIFAAHFAGSKLNVTQNHAAADGFIDAKDLEQHLGRSSGVAALIKVRYLHCRSLSRLPDQDATQSCPLILQEADRNGDGKIDYQEFSDLLKNQHQ